MKTYMLNYHLPPKLIAQHPVRVRSAGRLLVLNRCGGLLTDSKFQYLRRFLLRGDCLVLNDTKVLPARFYARRATGAALEGLFLCEIGPGTWQVMLKGLRKVRTGETIYLQKKSSRSPLPATILEKSDNGNCLLRIEQDSRAARSSAGRILGQIGFAPLPPYIKRPYPWPDWAADKLRYQTVYARKTGAVAAPTAGLHFTKSLIRKLSSQGINFAFITLHVGPGTFRPITAENLADHKIHCEQFSVDQENAAIINSAKKNRHRVIAVGTTCVRALETAAAASRVKAGGGKTDLFITPGYNFKIVDALVTNFHLPKSTLLALAAAFAGLDNILTAYRHAINQRYRFYSYGDAMLIL